MAGEPTLKRGHNNPHEWVVYAQKMLNQALSGGMHIDMPENGVFDAELEGTVINFQSRHGLGNDGEIGPNTWAALHKAVEAKQHAAATADADQDDQLSSPPREVHNPPGHRDENTFHERTDKHGDKVRVYDMDAETIHSAEWNAAVTAIIAAARANLSFQLPYVHIGVVNFEAASKAKVTSFVSSANQFEADAHVTFPWGLLVDGLDAALGVVYEPEKIVAKFVYEIVKKELVAGLEGLIEARADPVPGLQAKLEAGLEALSLHVQNQTAMAVSAVNAELDEQIEQAMDGQADVSQAPEWVAAMADWLGVPRMSADQVTGPVESCLGHKFDALIAQAQEELLRSG
jgi:peptidoglycan hydrolase-like protein with peptidoglycan-binding domain